MKPEASANIDSDSSLIRHLHFNIILCVRSGLLCISIPFTYKIHLNFDFKLTSVTLHNEVRSFDTKQS